MSLYSDIQNVAASVNLLISASTGFGVDSEWTLASVGLVGFEVTKFTFPYFSSVTNLVELHRFLRFSPPI